MRVASLKTHPDMTDNVRVKHLSAHGELGRLKRSLS